MPKKKPKPKVPGTRARERRIKLMVIPKPEPNTRTVLNFTGEGTVIMKGDGNVIMECGNCAVPLTDGVNVAQLHSIVFRCPNCGEYNETLA